MPGQTAIVGRTADGKPLELHSGMANRHGLIAGATGTGKTVTLQRLTEQFSRIGIPVFTADVKGDLSGLAKPGAATPRLQGRLDRLGITTGTPSLRRLSCGMSSAKEAFRSEQLFPRSAR